jgi:WD40 repeat protein
MITCFDGTITQWDVATGKELRHWNSPDPRNIVFSRDGQRAFYGSSTGIVALRDIDSGNILKRLADHAGGIPRVDMSRDERFGFAGSADGTATLWDLRTGEVIRRFRSGPFTPIFTSDSRTLLGGFYPDFLELWRIDTTLDELLTWTRANRFIPDLTCEQRALYQLAPLCDPNPTSVINTANAP